MTEFLTTELKILCIIPARSGSKGVPNKNIKLFRGQPLLSWSIQQSLALHKKFNMRTIVSTDSQDYVSIAEEYGAEAPFLRPASISGDYATDLECFQHCLEWLENNEHYIPDIILHLRPTQPLREISLIETCLHLFIKNIESYDSLRTVIPIEKSPFKMYMIEDNMEDKNHSSKKNKHEYLVPFIHHYKNIYEPYNQVRQILPQCYLHNGYIDIIKIDTIKKNSLSGKNIYPYIMNSEDNIDIDTLEDWKRGEKII
jgi:CMP-N,N'-diacetyllegionaminic acid synthase